MTHAAAHAPYYETLFASLRVDPREVHDVADLARLPVLRAGELEELAGLMVTDDAGLDASAVWGWRDKRDAFALAREIGSTFRTCARLQAVLPWIGLKNSDFPLFGRNWVMLLEPNGHARRLPASQRLPIWGLSRCHRIEVQPDGRGLDGISELRPVVLSGSGQALLQAARAGADLRPRLVLVSCGTVDEAQRGELERAFGCPVLMCYGHRHVAMIGWECRERSGYHIEEDEVVVEIVRDGAPVGSGEVGEIVVTDLTNHAVPLLRLATGDLGRWLDAPCPCGASVPRLEVVARAAAPSPDALAALAG